MTAAHGPSNLNAKTTEDKPMTHREEFFMDLGGEKCCLIGNVTCGLMDTGTEE